VSCKEALDNRNPCVIGLVLAVSPFRGGLIFFSDKVETIIVRGSSARGGSGLNGTVAGGTDKLSRHRSTGGARSQVKGSLSGCKRLSPPLAGRMSNIPGWRGVYNNRTHVTENPVVTPPLPILLLSGNKKTPGCLGRGSHQRCHEWTTARRFHGDCEECAVKAGYTPCLVNCQ
jgi:hypothetical protein